MNTLKKNIIAQYGKAGKEWLSQIPNFVQTYSKKWNLTHLEQATNLSYNSIEMGLKNNHHIVLKFSINTLSLEREAKALQIFAGFGAVNVLEHEPGALLLERALPGTSLKKFFPQKDLDAVKIVCTIIKKLHQAPIPPNHSFPHIKDWLTHLDKEWDIPHEYLVKAQTMKDFLFQTSGPDVLLHADLHHDNILKHSNEWVVIDPKGVIGDPAYEPAAFIRNPTPELLQDDDAHRCISNRIEAFSQKLGIDPNRIHAWCFIQAVLAWIWALEDNTDPMYFRSLTELFDEGNHDGNISLLNH